MKIQNCKQTKITRNIPSLKSQNGSEFKLLCDPLVLWQFWGLV